MAASSSGNRRYDVFPSFSGEDVRNSFLSHLLKELDRKSINTFIDHGIERSRSIGPELLLAIRETKISVVIFSKNYASSTWCLNELVEIHKCYIELDQMVIPIFYNVDPSEVRHQTGEFGKVFEETCNGKQEDQKMKWKQALTDVANLAGEHIGKGVNEARMIEKIAKDVLSKLITSPSNYSDGLVGIEAHIEAMNSRLCLEYMEAIMVGIVGPSGIGKSTIGRALFSRLSIKFPFSIFSTYRKTSQDDFEMKLSWEQQFLSKILGEKDLEISELGQVEQRLKHKKVLIVLDDVVELELLTTLVGKTEWFGSGSRIIVITQDKRLLTAHDIDIIYEVEFPSKDLALEMLCWSAFKQNSPPDGFMEVVVKVANLAGNLPLGLSILGSSLRKRSKNEWIEMLPRLQNILDGNIGKKLRVSYDRLNKEDQLLFIYVACHFNGWRVSHIQHWLGDSVNIGLRMLAEKSLIRITPDKTVEMHDLVKKLGREIVCAESIDNPGKRRFLMDFDDIRHVLTDNTGTETVHGILLNTSDINEPFSIHEKSFERMSNLQILSICYHTASRCNTSERRFDLPHGLVSLPPKLRVLWWNYYPAKSLSSTFKGEFLVKLIMCFSKLEKLWEGTQPLGNLKVMNMHGSKYLEVIPNLSKAISLEKLDLSNCISLVTLPSSIQNLTKLWKLDMEGCVKLEYVPTLLNLESLKYLDLRKCSRLRNFPLIFVSYNWGIEIKIHDCLWSKNLNEPFFLNCFMRYIPSQFRSEHIVELTVNNCNMLEKLWEGVQSLRRLRSMFLSECGNLTEIPNLSKANTLRELTLNRCKNLVMVPSTIGNLQKLKLLSMKECTGLVVLPMDVNLSSLEIVDFSGCSKLRKFPKISSSIKKLCLDDTAIEEVPFFIKNFSKLMVLKMSGCKRLKNISPNIFRLTSLKIADFSDCGGLITTLVDTFSCIPMYENIGKRYNAIHTRIREMQDMDILSEKEYFNFHNCFKLDDAAKEHILRSCFNLTVLPGGEVPTYFKHRASGDSLTVNLPQSVLSQDFLKFKACVMIENPLSLLEVYLLFNGENYKYRLLEEKHSLCDMNHLVMCSFMFRPTHHPSKLDSKYLIIKFIGPIIGNFSARQMIKGCGVQLLNVSLSPCGSDESSETEYNRQSGELCDVVEAGGSKKRMRMTCGTSRENINLPCGENVSDTGLTALNLELSSRQEAASSVSCNPCLKREALCIDRMITEQQDQEICILHPLPSSEWNPFM